MSETTERTAKTYRRAGVGRGTAYTGARATRHFFHVVLQTADGTIESGCEHEHRTHDAAVECARKVWHRIQTEVTS